MNQETKVGLFLLAAIGAILASAILLGDISLLGRRDHYYIDFKDVQALPPKAAVKISGVEIGKVLKVQLVDGHARVTIAIDPSIKLYEDASSSIGTTGIIGTRFVEIVPGTLGKPILPPKSVIRGTNSVGLEEMIKKIGSLFEDDEEHGDAAGNLKATMANLRAITDSLRGGLGGRAGDFKSIVENIKDLSQNARIFAKDLADITQNRKEDVKASLGQLRSITDRLDRILAKVEKGEGTIGALMSDEETADNVKSAVVSIKNVAESADELLGGLTKTHFYWNYRYRYDFRDQEGRSDAGIKLVPRPGKFYAFGVTNAGQVNSNEKHLEYERHNRFTVVMGSDWGPFTGYAGAIKSRGGVGLNFRPLWWNKKWGRRVELTSEASDFQREQIINGRLVEGTLLSVGGHIALNSWLWVGARGEDILERGAFMLYTNIVFRDKDLSNLVGLASFAR